MPYELNIKLSNIEPEVSRTVMVPNSINLHELHWVIQGAFGWNNNHLHEFQIGENRYQEKHPDADHPDEAKVLLHKDAKDT